MNTNSQMKGLYVFMRNWKLWGRISVEKVNGGPFTHIFLT